MKMIKISFKAKTAQWGIYLDIAKTLPAVFATILYGIYSDRMGRKTVMVLPIVGDSLMVISYILNAYFLSASIGFMVIGAIVSALFGNFAAILSATFSYIADVSTESSRTKRVTILESMIYLGGVVGNLAGGWLLQESGFIAVFILILAMYVLQMIYWIFIKESYLPLHGGCAWS